MNTINNITDHLDTTAEEIGDTMVKIGKRVFEKLSPQEIKERKEYNKEYFKKLASLSKEQKEFFFDIVSYAEKHGFDFKVPQAIEKNWPKNYDDMVFLFQGLSLDKINTKKVKEVLSPSYKNNNIGKEKEATFNDQISEAEELKKNL